MSSCFNKRLDFCHIGYWVYLKTHEGVVNTQLHSIVRDISAMLRGAEVQQGEGFWGQWLRSRCRSRGKSSDFVSCGMRKTTRAVADGNQRRTLVQIVSGTLLWWKEPSKDGCCGTLQRGCLCTSGLKKVSENDSGTGSTPTFCLCICYIPQVLL